MGLTIEKTRNLEADSNIAMYTKHENGDIKFVGEKMAYLINDAGTTD